MAPHSHSHDHAKEVTATSSNNSNNTSHNHSASCADGHSHDHSHSRSNDGLFVLSADPHGSNHDGCTADDDHKNKDSAAVVLSEDELARRSAMKRLKVASGLCMAFFFVEVVGGYLAGSLAVLSDAAHLFSDMASFMVAIFANYLAGLPSTTSHTFGLKRSESLAALFSMVSLALVCVWLGVEAVQRLYCMLFLPQLAAERYAVDGGLMSGIASIGVMVNLALAGVLGAEGHVHMPGADHGHSHSHDHGSGSEGGGGGCGGHGHGHSHHHDHREEATPIGASSSSSAAAHTSHHSHGDHDHEHLEEGGASEHSSLLPQAKHPLPYTVEHFNEVPPPLSVVAGAQQPPKPRNVNLHAAYLHVLGDLAQSVAVLVAGVVIWFRPAWIIVDPLCTLGFCILVFYSTLGVVRASMSVLLEEVPPQISWKAIYRDLAGTPHLRDVHDLHIWCISDGVPSLSLHASCDDGKCEAALQAITEICRRHGIEHITAQVQPGVGDCITCEHVVSNTCFESAHDS